MDGYFAAECAPIADLGNSGTGVCSRAADFVTDRATAAAAHRHCQPYRAAYGHLADDGTRQLPVRDDQFLRLVASARRLGVHPTVVVALVAGRDRVLRRQ